jgi:hypothetical protein
MNRETSSSWPRLHLLIHVGDLAGVDVDDHRLFLFARGFGGIVVAGVKILDHGSDSGRANLLERDDALLSLLL